MASDYTELNAGSGGDLIAVDTVSGVKHTRTKVQFGITGAAQDVDADNPLPVCNASNGTQNNLIIRYMDTVGDGSGTENANGDYSSTQGIFRIAPGAGEIYRIARLIVTIEDSTGFSATKYGNLTALTNGVQIRCHNGSTTLCDFTNGTPIVNNAGWAGRCYDADLKSWGTGNEFLVVRWTFTKAGQYVRLDGDSNEELQILLDDDLTGLVTHQFFAQGYKEDDPT